jgi:flagellar biosynthesis/type III secretory pathway chaperone
MNERTGPLLAVLRQQTSVCRSLVESLQQDRALVLRNEVAALEQSNQRKENLVLQLQQFERSRQQETQNLAAKLGIAADEARVSTLAPLLGGEGAALEEAAGNLRAVVASLKELVAVSYGFLEQSIVGIRSVLGLIASLRGEAVQTYDATGQIAAPGTERATLRSEV